MQIIVCSMIRSGGTVIYQLVKNWVEKMGLGKGLGYQENFYPEETNSWDVVKIPELNPECQSSLSEGKALGIYSFRELPKAVESAQQAFKLTNTEVLLWEERTRKAHEAAVKSQNHLHLISFDMIVNDFELTVFRLYEHLLAATLKDISAPFQLDRQKLRPLVYPYDPETLLMHNHFGDS